MADTESQDEVALVPPVAPALERASAEWFAPVRERLASLRSQGRMPHGLLLAGSPGTGQPEIGSGWQGACYAASLRSALVAAAATADCSWPATTRIFTG